MEEDGGAQLSLVTSPDIAVPSLVLLEPRAARPERPPGRMPGAGRAARRAQRAALI